MAPIKLTMIALAAGAVSAFAPASMAVVRKSTHLEESFGLGIGEDTYENQPDLLKGEQEYKQYMNKVKEDNMLNRKYPVVRRVRELDLLKATIDAGILSKLEKNGLDLATVEELLPLAEKLGLLSLVANNQQLLINGVAPLLIEGAPFLLPVVAGALEIGPPAFFLGSATAAGLDIYLLANDVEVPLLGISAGVFGGLLLVPLSVILAAVGAALSSLKK